MSSRFFKLPTLGIILAPFESGKTTLLNYMTYSSAEEVVALVIFSKDGIETYESNYDLVNRRYVHNKWDKDDIQKVIALGRKIKRNNPNHHVWVLFDDFIGQTKGFFETAEAEELITTLRSANCSMFVSAHQLQKQVSTLIRNNGKDIFIFSQSEPNGLKLMWTTWGQRSTQYANLQEFSDAVAKLPKHHFLHFSTATNKFTEMKCPHPHNCKCGDEEAHATNQMPKFRLFLHDDDIQEAEEGGYELVYGNKPGYDLSDLERTVQDPKNDVVDDGKPLFREKTKPGKAEVSKSDDESETIDHVEELRNAAKRKREEDKQQKKENKKRKKEPYLQILDEVNEKRNALQEQLSEDDANLRSTILRIFKFIKRKGREGEPDNHDKQMLDAMDANFLQQDFDAMPYEELLKAYTIYCDEKEMNKVITSTAHKYNSAKNIIHQAVRKYLNYTGDPSIFTHSLDVARHDSTIRAIAECTPGKKFKASSIDNFLTVATPIGSAMYAFWVQKQLKEKHDENLGAELSKAEADILLERIDNL